MKTNGRSLSRRNGRALGGQSGVGAKSLESSVISMAANGALAKAGKLAVRRLRSKGLPVTFQKGRMIVKKHADGREEVLGEVAEVGFERPKGVGYFVKK